MEEALVKGNIRRSFVVVPVMALVVSGCLGGSNSTQPPGNPTPAPGGTAPASAPSSGGGGPSSAEPATGTINVWFFPQGEAAEAALRVYETQFETANHGADIAYRELPEGDPYFQGINTALQGGAPPDVAVIEDRGWMQAGLVEELSQYFDQWGVSAEDFSPGGLARGTEDGDPSTPPIYGIGDFLGGNVLVYNKDLFDAAELEYPGTDASMHISEYVELCNQLAQPNDDPAQTIYGCSMPEWGIGIQGKDVFGPDGRSPLGNINSEEMIAAWDMGTQVIRDGNAPSPDALEQASESDLFAEGRLGITWTDFTEIPKYQENDITFGLAPFYVIKEGESFVDTFTAPYGTFAGSPNKAGALAFLRFLATDAQRIRMEETSDPALDLTVAEEEGYGDDDPVKAEYLAVLQHAQPQVFVPPGIDAWDPIEVIRLMTIENQTDSRPILDEMAAAAQEQADEVWVDWEDLAQ
ncbi:MAG: ABC transporter substrate-binding protein [Candidatus Limnocylindrales bacterium]